MDWLKIFNLVVGLTFTLCYLYQYIYIVIAVVKKPKTYPVSPKTKRYAVLISARNESAVIGHLCDSIREQDYPRELVDIIVVADNCTDDTKDVAAAHGAKVYERFDKERVGKGYALHDLFLWLKRDVGWEHYDGYFVIDADNLLDPHYISAMNDCFSAGHRIVTSYRNSKNYGDNWISSGYALWFLREARHMNNVRNLLGVSCVVTGTGFLVHRDIIERQGGWKHFLMTEDTEFSAENILLGEKIAYCHDAVFYDEQPVKFSQSWRQRKRWAKGYLQVLRRHGLKMLGAFVTKGNFSCYDMIMSFSPAFFISIVAAIVNIIAAIYAGIAMPDLFIPTILGVVSTVVNAYGLIFLVGLFTLILEWKRIVASTPRKILSLFTLPLFIATYIPISLSALFSKVEWKPIEHKVAISAQEIKTTKDKCRDTCK